MIPDVLRHQAGPSGHLPAISKFLRIAHGHHQCAGGQRADPGHGLELAAELVAPGPGDDLRFQFLDLPIQLLRVIEQPRQRRAHGIGELIVGIFQNLRHPPGDVMDPLRDDQPELRQQSADPVRQRGALTDASLPRPMQRQRRFLLYVLDRNERMFGRPIALQCKSSSVRTQAR